MEQKKKTDSIVSALLDAFNVGAKKALEKESTTLTSEEIKILTTAIKNLSEIVQHHNTAINELYLVQSHILKQFKSTGSSVDALSTGLGNSKKNKDEKPN